MTLLYISDITTGFMSIAQLMTSLFQVWCKCNCKDRASHYGDFWAEFRPHVAVRSR